MLFIVHMCINNDEHTDKFRHLFYSALEYTNSTVIHVPTY